MRDVKRGLRRLAVARPEWLEGRCQRAWNPRAIPLGSSKFRLTGVENVIFPGRNNSRRRAARAVPGCAESGPATAARAECVRVTLIRWAASSLDPGRIEPAVRLA